MYVGSLEQNNSSIFSEGAIDLSFIDISILRHGWVKIQMIWAVLFQFMCPADDTVKFYVLPT